jgi:hypothetical protein
VGTTKFLKRRLKEKLCEYQDLKRKADKIKRLHKIHDALEHLKAESADTEAYAGFLKYLLITNQTIKSAINLINKHKTELGLSSKFELD